MKKLNLSALLNGPPCVVIVVGAVVLVVEILFMELLHEHLMAMLKFSEHAWNLIDAVALVATISPVLYFMVRKMQKKAEQQSRLINDSSQDAIVIIDGEARITDWNPAAQRIFGYTREEQSARLDWASCAPIWKRRERLATCRHLRR